MASWLERPVDAAAEELRVCWRSRLDVSLSLEEPPADRPRVRGVVTYVALSGAYAMVLEPRSSESTHVPLGVVLAIRRPHFSEPADVLEGSQLELEQIPGQQALW